MSGAFARLALRLAAGEALRADPFIAAACSGRVFDSQMSPFEGDEPVPVIVFATEDDTGEDYSKQNGGPPFDQTVNLTLEITVCQFIDRDDDAIDLFVPTTDRESAALLDALEFFAVEALAVGDTPQSAIVRKVTRRVTRYTSSWFVSDETSAKLARRLVTLTMPLQGDDGQADPFDTPAGPFAALPEPLRTVATSLPMGSSGFATIQALVAKLSAPAAPAPFAGAAVATFAPQPLDPDVPPDPAAPHVPTILEEFDIP